MNRQKQLIRETFALLHEIGFQKLHKLFFAELDAVRKWPSAEVHTWQLRAFWERESRRKYFEY